MNHILPAMLCLGMLLVGVGSAHAQVSANVTSDTANGTYTEGSIDVRMIFSENLTFEEFNIVDGEHGFEELEQAYSITTTQIGDKHYALVAAYGDSGVQIIDITNPASPVATANITDGSDGFDVLNGAYSVTTTRPTYSPDLNPVEMVWKELKIANGLYRRVEDMTGAMDEMIQSGSNHYALVAANGDSGVQIIDIRQAPNPAMAFGEPRGNCQHN